MSGSTDALRAWRDGISSAKPAVRVVSTVLAEYADLVQHIERIRVVAADHVERREPGWGAWETTLRLCDEALKGKVK